MAVDESVEKLAQFCALLKQTNAQIGQETTVLDEQDGKLDDVDEEQLGHWGTGCRARTRRSRPWPARPRTASSASARTRTGWSATSSSRARARSATPATRST